MTPSLFLSSLDALLNDPAGRISAPVADILATIPDRQLQKIFDGALGEHPMVSKEDILGPIGASGVGILTYFLGSAQRGYDRGKRLKLERIIRSYTVSRPSISLTDQEKGLVRGMAALRAGEHISGREYEAFLAEFAYGGGQCAVIADPHWQGEKHERDANQGLHAVLRVILKPYQQFLAQTANTVAGARHVTSPAGSEIGTFLNQGSRWFEHTAPSGTFTTASNMGDLTIGWTPDGKPFRYGGDESLITIAAPGTGKSQVQVIPNLLSYPGSAFVLDVKGELWEATAGYREKHFGPVYRFAPTDPAGNTHAYNPFDFVSADPIQAAVDCELIASQIIAPDAGGKDPFWDNRGRDYLFTFALAVAFSEPAERRNLATVMEMLAVPVNFPDGVADAAYWASPTPKLMARLKALAQHYNIPALADNAVAVESSLNDRIDGVFDAARRYLSIFSRSVRLRAAMARSDWTPLALREQPGTTVYLCLSGDDIDTYTPIVRLIIQQHANLLLRHTVGSRLPITFFLDEFPQLGNMASILRLLDVGRGAKLRLWLFAQYLGQLRDTYGKRADGLINACRVRSFMQPDNQAASFLAPQLGTVVHLFSGEKKPLAEPYELMGRAYADKIIVTARGHDPVLLDKRYAYRDFADEMALSPPRIRLSQQA
ncbi:TRAG family protein [Rhodomicrobium vannielii ATCC 17100]|uniref:TRAG family protein n=1 Tax=Rhodomicrobium vannielii (strain ATCC 17100 / DSM 162 / LMG 4299 / NCIMB 10020 / ATH 3.1.1) TaxID=648757 RepID=E3I6M0_RHOVT|nr:type IV secretory system conjugative DNA transfer family protein [Rhodomicrobium vannielii]ADP70667.1 TRAG family protein [Rhodomicrobium vannielii ATCC 17100]